MNAAALTFGVRTMQIWPFSKYSSEEKRVKPRLYASIDRATYERLSAPNLASNLDVLNVINTALSPEYASVKTCKRLGIKIRGGFQNVQVLSLHILCLCVRHNGDVFQRVLAKSELLKDLGRIGDRTIWTATDIHRMVLHLLQEWAFEVKNYPDFQLMYNYLRSKNAPFEPRNGPISTIFQPYPGIEEQLMQLQQGSMVGGAPQPGDGTGDGQDQGADGEGQRPGSGGSSLIGPDLLRPGRSVEVLTSDLEVARGTVALLEEVMAKIKTERNWEGIREEYCVEVAEACLAVQKRIEVLMGGELEDESVMATALEVNDLALVALKVRMELLEIADGTREAPEVEGTGEDGDGEAGDADGNNVSEAPPLIDLLDLDYEPQPVASSDVQQSSQTNTVDPFAHLEEQSQQELSNPFAPAEAATSQTREEVGSNALEDDDSAPVIHSMIPTGSTPAAGGGVGGGNPFADDFEDVPAPAGAAIGMQNGNVTMTAQPPALHIPPNATPQNGGPMSAPAQVNRNTLFESSGALFPETFEAGPSTVPRRHTTDAFEGLVSIGKKNEKQVPDPPRGPSMKPPTLTSPTAASDAFNAFDSLG